MKQRAAGLACAEHERHMPGDGGRHRGEVIPLQQAVTQETQWVGHNYRKRGQRRKRMTKIT